MISETTFVKNNSILLLYFIGPLMIITQKVTGLAFNLHDGLTGKEEELTSNQKYYAVR